MRLGVLVSGRGSNLEAVLDAIADGHLPAVEAAMVIANRPGIRALEVAARRGVPWRLLARDEFPSADLRDGAIGRALAEASCDVALLAGYDQVLRPSFFDGFAGRTINIHPSLLPRHGGRGMVGLAVHAAVLAAGDAETGVTIHDVTPVLDAGPAIKQVRIPVIPGESADDLADRVLEIEHRTLVAVLAELSGSMTAASQAPIRALR
ncbi:MAG TPA: phosphoribosylglycinamide formyltransferase [Methylomirabilota bacterium]|jgi:phosphoribosylglycinamide formyltransferase-1|nr:phosphoribosylglycinamide formyltransferase [Methylomirabilota bacterium]